ncbi:LruC domain-containing protein [Pedobacter faecalis]|uniref:LruC domain-containing protein n=1 Tax=Pedobacter faecalis TaxID=3041495 RepID=UPI00254DD242|nr:LruC domain-containing protein [Pedobacter sp. ELA7]
MKKHLLSLAIIAGVFASSCKKDNNNLDEVVNKSIDEISAPAGFMWSGSRDVNLSLGVSDNSFGNQIHVVNVYTADPSKGGQLISTGSATLIKPFNTKVTLSSMVKQVYVEKIAPDGSAVSQMLDLTSDNVSASINATSLVSEKLAGSALRKLSVTTENPPTVPGNATEITSANWVSLPGNTTYVIKSNASTYNFNAFGANAIVYVQGTNINIGNIEFQNNLTLIVTSGSTVNFTGNFNWSGSNVFKNFGTVSITNNAQPKGGTFRNQGPLTVGGEFTPEGGTAVANTSTFTVNGNFNVGNNNTAATVDNGGTLTTKSGNNLLAISSLTNSGTMNFQGSANTTLDGPVVNSGTWTLNSAEITYNGNATTTSNSGTFTATNSRMILKGVFTNGGTVSVKELHINTGGSIINNCKWFITSDSYKNEINGPITNNSYFSVGKAININSGGKITLNNGALFVTKSIYDGFSEKITGTGSMSVLKITEAIPNLQNHQNSAKFSGALQVVYTSGTLPSSMFEGAATQKAANATIYIPEGSCMPETIGTAPVNTDPDGDGVHGTLDKFPNDATRAYVIDSENSTIAFEDNWPLKGDYDLNDVVVNFKYQIITNRDNKVVDVKATYRLLATGGNFQNGFGVEFPVSANKVSITSKTDGPVGDEIALESGQDKAVLILFSNSRARQLTWNTQPNVAKSPVVEFNVTLHFTDGPDQAAFGTANFNPFIWNSSPGYGRGFETHLVDKTPTNKANSTLFGTGDDKSGSGKYYRTANNLPWAIVVPVANFVYPLETVSITEGYLEFANWAITGGAQSANWYSTGSKNTAKLYTP